VFFFRASGRKTKNKNSSHGTQGSFFCLWAVRGRSAQGRALTRPWATPLTAGAMKIERRVVYNPTIHRGYLLEKIVILGADRAMREDPYRRCHANRAEVYAVSYLFLLNILFIIIIPSCSRVLVSQHKQQSTIIWPGITRLGSAWFSSVERCSSKRAKSSAFLPCAPSPSLLSSSLISRTFFFFQPKASSSVIFFSTRELTKREQQK